MDICPDSLELPLLGTAFQEFLLAATGTGCISCDGHRTSPLDTNRRRTFGSVDPVQLIHHLDDISDRGEIHENLIGGTARLFATSIHVFHDHFSAIRLFGQRLERDRGCGSIVGDDGKE